MFKFSRTMNIKEQYYFNRGPGRSPGKFLKIYACSNFFDPLFLEFETFLTPLFGASKLCWPPPNFPDPLRYLWKLPKGVPLGTNNWEIPWSLQVLKIMEENRFAYYYYLFIYEKINELLSMNSLQIKLNSTAIWWLSTPIIYPIFWQILILLGALCHSNFWFGMFISQSLTTSRPLPLAELQKEKYSILGWH